MATQTDALAHVYARSLYELAEQAGGADKITEIGDELETICELTRMERDLREFFASPIINRKARGESLRRCFNDRITDLMLRFLLVLNAKGRLGHLESINTAYDQLVQEAFGRVEVDVWTPAPLDARQLAEITSHIQKALNKEPVIHAWTDPAMIGGIRLRVGDQLIDVSVAAKLKRLKNDLLVAGGSKVRAESGRFLQEDQP